MVAREAMAYGRPVVATAVGGLVDAVEEGVTGLLVPAGDIAALRAAIQRLLNDADLRHRLGANARASARRRFSFESAAGKMLEVYELVTGLGSVRRRGRARAS
jgi:glycosyltransferase involved in cell wall biosynthesis